MTSSFRSRCARAVLGARDEAMSETMTDVSRTLVRAHRIYHQSRRAARVETFGTIDVGGGAHLQS